VTTTRDLKRHRSCLSVPGSSARMQARAVTFDADQVLFDLEDATAPSDKAGARAVLVDAHRQLDALDELAGLDLLAQQRGVARDTAQAPLARDEQKHVVDVDTQGLGLDARQLGDRNRTGRGEVEVLADRRGGVQRRNQADHVLSDAPAGRRHRLTALTDARLLEVSTPELEDVVRFEDDYGRATCALHPSAGVRQA